jgi:hypothetical protein
VPDSAPGHGNTSHRIVPDGPGTASQLPANVGTRLDDQAYSFRFSIVIRLRQLGARIRDTPHTPAARTTLDCAVFYAKPGACQEQRRVIERPSDQTPDAGTGKAACVPGPSAGCRPRWALDCGSRAAAFWAGFCLNLNLSLSLRTLVRLPYNQKSDGVRLGSGKEDYVPGLPRLPSLQRSGSMI